jgi:hypothetical protein
MGTDLYRQRYSCAGGYTSLALCARVAAALFALAMTAGCAHHYALSDFPKADSSAGGLTVSFKGRLWGFAYGVPPMTIPRNVYMCEPWVWTVVVDVTDARPEVPPFVVGRKVKISLQNPITFFGTNNLVVGNKVEKSITAWRGQDGYLHAVSARESDVPKALPGRAPTGQADRSSSAPDTTGATSPPQIP